jgi:hypothetical protein
LILYLKLEDHKRELSAIETIKKLYDEGLHPRAIARVLISMRIPAKKKGTWHHHVVITILKREDVYIERPQKGRKS